MMSEANAILLEPAQGSYSVRDVARFFDLPERKLRYWAQTGFLEPSLRASGRVLYSFRDLIAVKVAKELLAAGLPLRRVRRSLDALRVTLPRADHPLSHLRIRCESDRVVVQESERSFEAVTGQLLLDFELDAFQAEVAQVLRMPTAGERANHRETRTAYDWFLEGCELERACAEQGRDATPARECYETALELDPHFAAAWTNLGGLLAEAGDIDGARDHFEHALRCDPDQPEARINLAELALRTGQSELAIVGYRQALSATPDSVEAHYGLARALLMVGGRSQALAHLERFCRAVESLPRDSRTQSLIGRWESAKEVLEHLRRELQQS